MYEAVTTLDDGRSHFINFVQMGESQFVHRQIEKRDGKTFMRMKVRRI